MNKITYNNIINIICKIKDIMYRYHFKKISITKKRKNRSIRWGIVPNFMSFISKSMSDNIHYVNLLPYKHRFCQLVVDHPYFRQIPCILRKISTGRGCNRGGTSRLSKIQKSLYIKAFGKERTKNRHARNKLGAINA